MTVNFKRKKINTEPEKNLLTGLITSDKFIREIQPILKIKHLQIPYAKKVAQWCLDYYKQYGKAPQGTIQDIFNSKVRGNGFDEDEEELIEKFLSELSERFEEESTFNEQFILDQSEKYLAERNLQSLSEDIKANLSNGKIDEAESVVAKHMRTARPLSASIDVLKDEKEIVSGIDYEEDVLLTLPGTFGEMVGPLCRSDFLAFIAPMKRGKSWWLLDMAVRCILRGLKVLYISLEMPKEQMINRLYQNFLGQTKKAKEISIPYFNGDNEICYKSIGKKGLSSNRALRKAKSLNVLVKNGGIRLLCRPTYSFNTEDAKIEIYNLAYYEDFYPDVIIFDYADITSPEPISGKDVRHRINDTWAAFRGLAQETNTLLITGTQGSRATFKKDIKEDDISEDIRKLAHVTHMIALNQNGEDKKLQMMRASMLAIRNEEFHVDYETIILYSYAMGKAYLDSKWKKDVIL